MLNAMICAVIVVPIFAPKIMEIACGNVIKPALTNPITITVVALLLCKTAVTNAPANTPMIGFFVSNPKIYRIRSPAAFCKPSLIISIPNKNNANPPNNPNNVFNILPISSPLALLCILLHIILSFFNPLFHIFNVKDKGVV